MTAYFWNGTAHRAAWERDTTIAYDFMTSNGWNDSEAIDNLIAEGLTPERAADEAIASWDLLKVYDDEDYGGAREGQPCYPDLTRESMVEAFRDFFDKRPDRDA